MMMVVKRTDGDGSSCGGAGFFFAAVMAICWS